jgi:hypothetical protein
VIPFDILLVTINVLINSFSFFTSWITIDGLSVNWEQARGKQWLAFHQPAFVNLWHAVWST